MSDQSSVDVVIIGSGISSLTCAVLLGMKGKSVRVLEQYNKPGGYMHCFNRFGIRFDTGAHYVGAMGEGQPFRTMLEYLGVLESELPDLFVPLDPDGFDVFRFPDFSIELPRGYEHAERRMIELFPSEAGAVRGYFGRVRQVASLFPTYEFRDGSVRDPASQPMLIRALETPLKAVVNELTSNPRLQSVFYAYCALHGVFPEDVSFGLHAIVTDSLIRGPYGLAAGGDTLASRFVQRVQALGGQVSLRKKVVKIENSGRLASAVFTEDGERIDAKWVISGIHPRATLSLVGDPGVFSPAFRERVAGLRESTGIFGVYAVCSPDVPLDPLKNYYYFDSDDPDRLFDHPGVDQPPKVAFVSSSRRVSKAVACADGRLPFNLHAACSSEWFAPWETSSFGKRPAEYEAQKREYGEKVMGLIDRFEPGFRASVQQHATSSTLTNQHFNGSPGGTAYGLYHSIQNTGARAFGPRTHVANLLLTGQNCLFPGLLGAAVAGLRTSGHILGIGPLLKELSIEAKGGA